MTGNWLLIFFALRGPFVKLLAHFFICSPCLLCCQMHSSLLCVYLYFKLLKNIILPLKFNKVGSYNNELLYIVITNYGWRWYIEVLNAMTAASDMIIVFPYVMNCGNSWCYQTLSDEKMKYSDAWMSNWCCMNIQDNSNIIND